MKPAALPASLARSLIPPLEKVVTDEIWEADVAGWGGPDKFVANIPHARNNYEVTPGAPVKPRSKRTGGDVRRSQKASRKRSCT